MALHFCSGAHYDLVDPQVRDCVCIQSNFLEEFIYLFVFVAIFKIWCGFVTNNYKNAQKIRRKQIEVTKPTL